MSDLKNYLVTGGAGFIGSHLVENLLRKGHKVVCLDNFNDYYDPAVKRSNIKEASQNSNFILVEGDILDRRLLDNLFIDCSFDIIIHLAARAGVRPSLVDPLLYEQVNVRGTINLLDQARNANINGFIFGSSSSVYGINSSVPFSENDPISQPISPYAATKRAAELMCYTYHHIYGLPITCLRFFTVYGPRQRPDMAIHKFTKLIDEGREITLFGDGKSRRDYTYIDDIIDGIIKSAEKPSGFKIYNLGESYTIELLDLIKLIEKSLNKKAKICRLPDQPGDVPITYANIDRAEKELGYKPSTSIEQGVPRFIAWYMKNKSGMAKQSDPEGLLL